MPENPRGADPLRLVIYCDEAHTSTRLRRYHHFYGGLLVEESRAGRLEGLLRDCAGRLGLMREAKWQNVDRTTVGKMEAFVDAFFDAIQRGEGKLRIMYLDARFRARNLGPYQRQHGFYILYYQFLTRAFGLPYLLGELRRPVVLRLLFDKLPDTNVKSATFKAFLRDIPKTRRFRRYRLSIPADGIGELDSRKHRLAQGIDLVIGALGFALNRLYKPAGTRPGGVERTAAKKRLARHIVRRLRDCRVKNIGITTGLDGQGANLYHHPARVWVLRPSDFAIDERYRGG